MPRNIAANVRYLPFLGLHAIIVFCGSNICCVSSLTVIALYEADSRLVNGAKPGKKKCNRGYGIMLTANLRRSAFNCEDKKHYISRCDVNLPVLILTRSHV